MAPIRKTKKTSSFEPYSRISVVVPATKGIDAFTRVTKTSVASHTQKSVNKVEPASSSDAIVLKELSNVVDKKTNGLKRKPDTELRAPCKVLKTQTGRLQAVDFAQENVAPTTSCIRSTTPEPSRVTPAIPKREPDTPTKTACHRLESFQLSSSPAKGQTKSLFPCSSSPAAPTPCPKESRRGDALPAEVQELIDLHSSFLSVLSLHYAHNGTATPVDLKSLTPAIGKSCGARNPTTEDIRRILAIQQRSIENPDKAALLSVWDYGHGKTCIEYTDSDEAKAWGRNRVPLETQKLSRDFRTFMREIHAVSLTQGLEPTEFVQDLPLTRLHRRATSRVKTSTVLSKGQARLTELKQGAILAQKRTEPKPAQKAGSTSEPNTPSTPAQRGTTLLDRIRAKESLLASQPAGPTPEQLARRSALQHVPEVVNILSLLSGNSYTSSSPASALGISPMTPAKPSRNSDDALAAMLGMSSPVSSPSPRSRGMQAMFGDLPTKNVSMSLQQMIEKVRNSMRSPIAAGDVGRVIRLLAGEVCPEWIQVKEFGSVRGVTIRGGSPAMGWKAKVDELLMAS